MCRVCSRSSSSTTASKSPCSPTTPARRRGQPQHVRPQCHVGCFQGTTWSGAHTSQALQTSHSSPSSPPHLTPFLPAIQHGQHESLICRDFNPSDGLEPLTPSL